MYPASIRWVAQWYPSVHWFNQWHASGIPVYTGPHSVHWLRVRGYCHFDDEIDTIHIIIYTLLNCPKKVI